MNENSSYYYESGCKFVFNAKGYEVVAANSLLGKVVISINGDTVFKGRVINNKSSHKITYDGKVFEIELKIISQVKASATCKLLIDEQFIKAYLAEPRMSLFFWIPFVTILFVLMYNLATISNWLLPLALVGAHLIIEKYVFGKVKISEVNL